MIRLEYKPLPMGEPISLEKLIMEFDDEIWSIESFETYLEGFFKMTGHNFNVHLEPKGINECTTS